MAPEITGIDHVHLYVANRNEAEQWYERVLGFKRVEALMSWATKDGPLTLEDPSGNVHLALFESEKKATSTIAFGTSGEGFLSWKRHLEEQSLKLRLADHQLSWSLYFTDPYGNYHEITTYDTEHVAKGLA